MWIWRKKCKFHCNKKVNFAVINQFQYFLLEFKVWRSIRICLQTNISYTYLKTIVKEKANSLRNIFKMFKRHKCLLVTPGLLMPIWKCWFFWSLLSTYFLSGLTANNSSWLTCDWQTRLLNQRQAKGHEMIIFPLKISTHLCKRRNFVAHAE